MTDVKYQVVSLDLAPRDVLNALAEGLSYMAADGGGFQGEIGMVLYVPGEYAELVEEAARRQNVTIKRTA